ncbi:MAG TPA: hydroxyacid dehydrogenase [Candidatus Paceibacterota bacterium]
MTKVAVFGYESWEREYLAEHTPAGAELIFFDQSLTPDKLVLDADFEILVVFVGSQIDEVVLANFPKVRAIITRSTGYDHIDLASCRTRGITVSNVPGYGEATVAEYTFALLLSLSRKIYLGYHQVRESGSFSVTNLRGFDLEGKTIGVVGTGRIGRHVARLARGFGLKIIAHDTHPDEEFAKSFGLTYRSLPELLGESDIITLHVPALPETEHLLNAVTFSQMKRGAVLINTSRGSIIDTQALVLALRSGQVAGAALDVLEEEGVVRDELDFLVSGHPGEHNLKTVLANHVLIDLPNVIVTPHNAFNTVEALRRILDTTLENLRGVIDGKPINVIP